MQASLREDFPEGRHAEVEGRADASRDILKETNGVGPTPTLPPHNPVMFRWFVKERYIPMRRGSWSLLYKKTNTYNLEHYLIGHFGGLALRNLGTFEIHVWLNNLECCRFFCGTNVAAFVCQNDVRHEQTDVDLFVHIGLRRLSVHPPASQNRLRS